jgi:gluconate 2-dehydrogenase gamma chain
MSESLSRRDFVATVGSLGAVWLLADTTERARAVDHAAHQLTQAQPSLSFFSREQATEIEAITSRIIPTDDTPGAREAGVIYFIDRALTTFAKDQQSVFSEGLAKLPRDVEARYSNQTRFSALTPAQQDEVLASIEQGPFFGTLRFATICGMFSLPTHGGNRDWVGWRMIGHDLDPEFRPPFGWYDTPANRRALIGGDE